MFFLNSTDIFWPTAYGYRSGVVTSGHLPGGRLNAGIWKKDRMEGGEPTTDSYDNGETNARGGRGDSRAASGRHTTRRRDGRQRSRRSGRFGGYGITAVCAAVRRWRHRTRLLSPGHVRACTEPTATVFSLATSFSSASHPTRRRRRRRRIFRISTLQ